MERCRCRICLTNSGNFYDIFDECKSSRTYAENISHIAEVEIERRDGLPQQICFKCCAEVMRIFEFGMLIRRSNERLRKELKERQLEVGVEDENVKIVDNDSFHPAEVVDVHMSVLEEEILSEEIHDERQEMTIVDECVKAEEMQIVEEIIEVEEELCHSPEEESSHRDNDLLVELAQVAASQENVLIEDQGDTGNNVDECDDDYLIPYNPAEESLHNCKPPKWKCGECKMILRGDVSYEGHMNIHKQLRPHECLQCHWKFRCRTVLKKHKKIRHSSTSNPTIIRQENTNTDDTSDVPKCTECNEIFENDVDILLHELLEHDNPSKIMSCPFCPDLMVNNLVDHLVHFHLGKTNTETLNHHHTTTSWHCICSKTFSSVSDFNSHRQSCNSIEECESIHTDNVEDQHEHYIENTDDVVYCEICKRKLLRKNLAKHILLHERKHKKPDVTEKLLCTYCPREFKNTKSLHQHEKIHQGESADAVHVCGECDREYSSQYLLETHRKQAHKERDHICSICGNAFKLKNQLVNHLKLHLEKNIKCPHCDKKYARQFDLNVHLRSHTGETPYACHLCEKRFAIKVRLTYHLQKHYGVKHQCKQCGAEFNSKQKLKAHSFKHTGMPYRCELCANGFATRVVFKRHLNRVHHVTMTEEALTEMFQRNTGKTIKIEQVTELQS